MSSEIQDLKLNATGHNDIMKVLLKESTIKKKEKPYFKNTLSPQFGTCLSINCHFPVEAAVLNGNETEQLS